MTSGLVSDALLMAVWERKPTADLMHHSYRDSQYTGALYQKLLKENQFLVNMSRIDNCYDNAPTESFFMAA